MAINRSFHKFLAFFVHLFINFIFDVFLSLDVIVTCIRLFFLVFVLVELYITFANYFEDSINFFLVAIGASTLNLTNSFRLCDGETVRAGLRLVGAGGGASGAVILKVLACILLDLSSLDNLQQLAIFLYV